MSVAILKVAKTRRLGRRKPGRRDRARQLAWNRNYWRNGGRERHEVLRLQRMQELRDLIAELRAQPCLDCGGRFPAVCMDFDHARGEKLACISTMSRSWNVEKVRKELGKCDVVCSNCHRIRTEARRVSSDT